MPGASGADDIAVVGTGHGPFAVRVALQQPGKAPVELAVHDTVWPGRVLTYRVDSGAATLVAFPAPDADADGVADLADCATSDKTVAPGLPEVCANGKDDDCDGLTDAADPACQASAKPCSDLDLDGYADCSDLVCAPTGACGDCDDAGPAVHPGATEAASALSSCSDGRDNDCDGAVDATGATPKAAPVGLGCAAGRSARRGAGGAAWLLLAVLGAHLLR